MTVIVDTNRNSQPDHMVLQDAAPGNDYQESTGTAPSWVEDSPSYLTHVQALLADFTEEDKDAIHVSLQEE